MAETFDETVPAGSEAISNGDNRIRSLKTCIKEFLRGQATEGVEAIFPGSDSANPVFRYRGLKGTTGGRPTAGQYGLYSNTTKNVLERDNGSSWDAVATLIPAGSVTCWFQASPPTGWTQVTTHTDKVLRVVSGSGGGSGGSTAFSSCWTSSTTGSEASHTHTVAGATDDATPGAGGSIFAGGAFAHKHNFSVTSGSGSAHSHTVQSYSPQYIDMILASKD